jgi:hypothetical protein
LSEIGRVTLASVFHSPSLSALSALDRLLTGMISRGWGLLKPRLPSLQMRSRVSRDPSSNAAFDEGQAPTRDRLQQGTGSNKGQAPTRDRLFSWGISLCRFVSMMGGFV